MDDQPAPVETSVSAEPDPGRSDRASSTESRKTYTIPSAPRVRSSSLILAVVGFLLLAAGCKRLASRMEASASSSDVLPSGHATEVREQHRSSAGSPDDKIDFAAVEVGEGEPAGLSAPDLLRSRLVDQGLENDDWGLPSLEHFEKTLPPKLKEGKEALAAWASEFFASDTHSEEAEAYQRAVAQALSNGSSGSLVGMTIVIENTKPLSGGLKDEHRPQSLRVTKIIGYYRWNLVFNAEDVLTKKEYSVNIPIIDMGVGNSGDVCEEEMRQAAVGEEGSILQACGSTPAELAASEKGIAVPLYAGKVSGLDQVHSVGNVKIYSTATLMERVVGDLGRLRCRAREVESKARDYIAARLLHILLKLEQSGVGHLRLDWSSLFLREDGSFFLGNLGSGAPFGEGISPIVNPASPHSEPNLTLIALKHSTFIPQAKANMWGLGVLLFQLYTGTEHPYGKIDGIDQKTQVQLLSQYLLLAEIRSEVLVPQLQTSQVPDRWAELIGRLLEPHRRHRIGGFQVFRDFPDLLTQPAE